METPFEQINRTRPANLNEREMFVLLAIVQSSELNGGDFTYADDVLEYLQNEKLDFSMRQLKGYLSQLVQKEYIDPIDPEWEQINVKEVAADYIENLDELVVLY